MVKVDKHSLAGIALAMFVVISLAGTGLLGQLFANGLGRAPRELRLGSEIGLINPNSCNDKFLKSSITRESFASKAAIIVNTIAGTKFAYNEMVENGIVANGNKNTLISRKEAVETMARAAMFINSKGLFIFSPTQPTNYRDYNIPAKYAPIMSYLQNKFIVRGMPNGLLAANKKLTQREAVYFLFRLYESISADMLIALPNEGISFIDIPNGHPVNEAIKNLTAAGAFDRAILRPSFDGNSYITNDDISEVIGGIFDRSGKECDSLKLSSIFADSNDCYTTRGQITLALEYILDEIAPDKIISGSINYIDVPFDSPEHRALVKLAGYNINPGYRSNVLSKNEPITWFEAVNLLDQTMKYAEITKGEKVVDMNAPADKADFERLKNILIAKKAKIRAILGPRE